MGIPERLERLVMSAGFGKRQVRGELARVCKISPQAIGQWFNGSTKSPNADHLAMIAKAYGANLLWIVTGEGPMLTTVPLDKDEARMLDIWRQLPAKSKKEIKRRFEEAQRSLDLAQAR